MKKNLRLSICRAGKVDRSRRANARSSTEQSMAELLARGPIDKTFTRLGASPHGLSVEDAAERLVTHGANEVARGGPPSWMRQLLQAFSSPFAIVLLVLAAVSYVMGVHYADPGTEDYAGFSILLIMVLVSGLLRFFQEFRSQRAADKLKAMVRTRASVQRQVGTQPDGKPSVERRDIAVRELVPGDIVYLHAGDIVPADLRLIESRDLLIGQAALTGESLPVEKYDTLGAVAAKRASAGETVAGGQVGQLLDLPNVCFMGTTIVSGTATALVIATGAQTYFGSLAGRVLHEKRTETSFDKGVNSVTWLLIRFMLVMVPVVFLIQGITKGDWLGAFTFALAVAVGLTPEMLPMIVSANLAKGAVAMARRKVVVKRLNAVQNFGAMDVLCTDKTGTLTCDRIAVNQWLDTEGSVDDSVLGLAWLNSYHQTGRRNPIDLAVLAAAASNKRAPDAGTGRLYARVDELAFDFLRRRLSVIVERADGLQRLICKGAVEEVLAVSQYLSHEGQRVELTQAMRSRLLARARALASGGQRVLLVASRDIPRDAAKRRYEVADERDLVVHGMLTFMDPPKESAAPALAALRAKGISVKVLTGDTAAVAQKVCKEVGIDAGEPLAGDDIDRMDDDTLALAVEKTVLFARLAPLQKSRIVCALKANGHTVGFLGDGINDAPALRDADVGISVDNAADIAKETADIILLEKSLAVLETGVVKGRETFGNILKYLNMTASSNFGNVFSVLVASAVLPWEPMLALQLLLQNLIYDLSQMLLPWDRMDEEFLAKPRKWDAGNIGRFMVWMGPTSSVFDMTTFALLWYVFGAGHLYHAQGGDGGQIIMNSGWFIEGLVSQTLVVHLLRTRKLPFFQSTASWQVLLSTSCAIAIGCWLPFSPFAASLGFTHLPSSYWGWLIATMIGYVALAQVVKTIYVKVYGKWF